MRLVVLPFISAILLYLSFPPAGLFPLAWGCLIPFLVYIFLERKGWRAGLASYLSGYLFFAIGFSWIGYVAPIGPFLLAIYFALYFLVFSLVIRQVNLRYQVCPELLSIPVTWTILELIRGKLLTGLPWFYLGHTQQPVLPLIQLADISGVYGVSLLVVFANGLGAKLVIKLIRREDLRPLRIWLVFFICLVAATLIYGWVRLGGLSLRSGPYLAIIQGNIPQELKELIRVKKLEEVMREREQIYQKHTRLTDTIQGDPDLIIWAEASFPYPIYASNHRFLKGLHYSRLVSTSMRLAKRMLIGTEVWDHGARRLYNSALYVDPREGVIGRYDKVHLVPFGEYIPLREELPFIVDLVQRYSGLSLIDMQPGKGWEVFECRGERFGVAICFEGLFPEITRVYKDQGASFLLNISNDGWFKGSAELDQILQICVFRAVEFRIGVVRATNTGISAFISPDGRIDRVLESPNGKRKEIEGVLEGPILLSSSGSLYTEFGDMVLYSLTFVMGCIILMRSFVLIYRRYFG